MSRKSNAVAKVSNVTAVTPQYYTVIKEGNTLSVAFTKQFVASAQSLALGLDQLIKDSTPTAIMLWEAYKHLVAPPSITDKQRTELSKREGFATLSALQFYRLFDSTIPAKSPAVQDGKHVCTAECTAITCRRTFNAHAVLNRLTYLTTRIGKAAAGDNPKPLAPKERAKKAEKRLAVFVQWFESAKISLPAAHDLLTKVFGMVDKAGRLNKTGKALYAAVKGDTE